MLQCKFSRIASSISSRADSAGLILSLNPEKDLCIFLRIITAAGPQALFQKALVALLRFVASQRKPEEFHSSLLASVLVIELTRLGDVMVMLPSLARLREVFRNATFRVLVDQRYVSLLSAIETGMEFVGFEDPGTIPGLARVVRFVKRSPVDLAVSMSSPRRNVLATLASKSRFKLGYLSYIDSLTPFLLSTKVEGYGFLPPTSASYGEESIYRRPAKILEALGIDLGNGHWRPQLKSQVYRLGLERLTARGVIPEKPFVLIHPFSGWKYREWALESFISLGAKIITELDHSVLLVCERKDLPRISAALSPGSSIRVFGSSDLLDVALLMKEASLMVSNDSGPLHLAAAMGCPTIGLFGPAPPALTAPQVECGSYLYQKVECSPCDQRRCLRSDNPCMGLHTVDLVFQGVSHLLENKNSRESATHNVQG